MPNIESILKSRDITLSTKVQIVGEQWYLLGTSKLQPPFHGRIGKKWKQWQILFSWAPKSLQMVTTAMKLKDICSLEEKL